MDNTITDQLESAATLVERANAIFMHEEIIKEVYGRLRMKQTTTRRLLQ